MFSNVISENSIPPNFLNSIFTNMTLYNMFKDSYEDNLDYFQNKDKDEYLSAMLIKIEDLLYSDSLSEYNIKAIKLFFDDFLASKFIDKSNLLKTKLFRGLNYHLVKDNSKEYKKLYDYIFDKTNYKIEVDNLMSNVFDKLNKKEKLSLNEYSLLNNYVLNNIDGFVSIDIINNMFYLHAYKINHIFDIKTTKELLRCLIRHFFVLEIKIEYGENRVDVNTNTIYLDTKLLDNFIFGNYVELINMAFFEANQIIDYNLLINNLNDYNTLKCIINMICRRVDLNRIYIDDTYKPVNYFNDMKASSFVKTLRFFQSIGVDLFSSYISSKLSNLNIDNDLEYSLPDKMIPLDILIEYRFNKSCISYLDKYPVLKLVFDDSGKYKSTLNIIKSLINTNKEFLSKYLSNRIILPDKLISDIKEFSVCKSKNKDILSIIDNLAKNIYPDIFYYSLTSAILLYKGEKIDYLNDLEVKIKLIKDIPLTHKFIDIALFDIEEMKQNY